MSRTGVIWKSGVLITIRSGWLLELLTELTMNKTCFIMWALYFEHPLAIQDDFFDICPDHLLWTFPLMCRVWSCNPERPGTQIRIYNSLKCESSLDRRQTQMVHQSSSCWMIIDHLSIVDFNNLWKHFLFQGKQREEGSQLQVTRSRYLLWHLKGSLHK